MVRNLCLLLFLIGAASAYEVFGLNLFGSENKPGAPSGAPAISGAPNVFPINLRPKRSGGIGAMPNDEPLFLTRKPQILGQQGPRHPLFEPRIADSNERGPLL
uniref:Secreted protein n=1 Tax=Panagrolaimus davidi TaxID=227884 RepID=A0A914QY99_9BILA